MLATLTTVGALMVGGLALAQDNDGGAGFDRDGAPGAPGQATAHCKQQYSMSTPSLMQCGQQAGGSSLG